LALLASFVIERFEVAGLVQKQIKSSRGLCLAVQAKYDVDSPVQYRFHQDVRCRCCHEDYFSIRSSTVTQWKGFNGCSNPSEFHSTGMEGKVHQWAGIATCAGEFSKMAPVGIRPKFS
jgi:hypothetical protein